MRREPRPIPRLLVLLLVVTAGLSAGCGMLGSVAGGASALTGGAGRDDEPASPPAAPAGPTPAEQAREMCVSGGVLDEDCQAYLTALLPKPDEQWSMDDVFRYNCLKCLSDRFLDAPACPADARKAAVHLWVEQLDTPADRACFRRAEARDAGFRAEADERLRKKLEAVAEPDLIARLGEAFERFPEACGTTAWIAQEGHPIVIVGKKTRRTDEFLRLTTLDGREVVVLCDGSVREPLTVGGERVWQVLTEAEVQAEREYGWCLSECAEKEPACIGVDIDRSSSPGWERCRQACRPRCRR